MCGRRRRVSPLVQQRPLRASLQSRPPLQLYGPVPLRRRTPSGSSAASSASASSWFWSSCPRRWRPHPGCMIRLQSSMSNHIPVSAARAPRPGPLPPAPRPAGRAPCRLPFCALLPRFSPRPPSCLLHVVSLFCSLGHAGSGRLLVAPGCGFACAGRRGADPARLRRGPAFLPPPAPFSSCYRVPVLFSPSLPGDEEGATSPRLPSGPARAQSRVESPAAAGPARPGSPRRCLSGGVCRAGPGRAAAGKGSAPAAGALRPWAVSGRRGLGAPYRGEAGAGRRLRGTRWLRVGSLIEA